MIESSGPTGAGDLSIGAAVISAARQTFAGSLKKIRHCLEQLSDEDVLWRPHPTHNNIAIIINHLCGNVRQWIVAGVGDTPDARNRPAEFADPGPVSTKELIDRLDRAVAEVDATLAKFDPADLLQRRRIQAFDAVLLHAIFDTASHFVGHTHQIVYITRTRLGERYQFEWTPATKEQGA
jgi:hypothetical protein